MAAPSDTVRSAPTGRILEDGFSTKLAFARDPDVNLWEKTVTPPGVDGGDEIELTTMHNTVWRTFTPRNLKTLTEVSATCGYDPQVYSEIINNLVNQEGAITCHFPDGSKISFYGYLKMFEPSENQEGEMPEADVTIVATNYDSVNDVEASPVVTSVAGT